VAHEVLAEGTGALLLTATVVGSGIMGERLADGNAAIALLANTGATVGVLATLIALFGPISGAHFNPVVTLNALINGQIKTKRAIGFVLAQIAGCCLGAMLANVMFELPLLQASTHVRTGGAQWLSEFVATFGLALVVLHSPSVNAAAWRVPLWIGAAYWFTASTSFANPAISVGRALSDTFAGIRPVDAPAFVVAQLLGAFAGLYAYKYFFGVREAVTEVASKSGSGDHLRP
jgi:glycerol uptake facilitator-like aquaporin